MTVAVLIFVTLQRLGELLWARRNTALLMQKGAIEIDAGHYPLIVSVHVAWLAGLWLLGWRAPINMYWLAIFALMQIARLWVLTSLGSRWTTRIIVLPGAPLVKTGPYRFLAHPNYVIVACEILVLPLVFDLVAFGVIFSVLNAVVLLIRLRAENAALT